MMKLGRSTLRLASRIEKVSLKCRSQVSDDRAFGYPRDFLENKYVYLVISSRAVRSVCRRERQSDGELQFPVQVL
jgi:hypothetical protein